MAQNILAAGAVTIPRCGALHIQVNAALTGTIVVTAGGIVQGTITNPVAGNDFRYGNLSGLSPITVNASGVCDISVSAMSRIR